MGKLLSILQIRLVGRWLGGCDVINWLRGHLRVDKLLLLLLRLLILGMLGELWSGTRAIVSLRSFRRELLMQRMQVVRRILVLQIEQMV